MGWINRAYEVDKPRFDHKYMGLIIRLIANSRAVVFRLKGRVTIRTRVVVAVRVCIACESLTIHRVCVISC